MKHSYFTLIMFSFTLALVAGPPSLAAEADKLAQAEAVLKSPNFDFPEARKALELYESLMPGVANPAYLLERLTRVCFILGDLTEKNEPRRQFYEKGRAYADRLLQAQPQGVQGYYWQALHLCGQAEVSGARVGLQLLPQIIEKLDKARTLDESYDCAGPHRVLGRIYFEAPAWPFSVGDMNKSLNHLSKAVQLAPQASTNHLYLAETLIRLGKYDQARQELDAVPKAPLHPIHPGGLEEDRGKARKLLEELEGK
ncbi:MAG: tetratricopeptide repeat protein [Deltaproteobacteria bacterium]|nr:tetratricopeptide repeat protein [Deltaproteobacteria bacterium]